MLAELAASGKPLVEGLRAAATDFHPGRTSEAFTLVADRLAAGATLANALAQPPSPWPPKWAALARAGQAQGATAEVLRRA